MEQVYPNKVSLMLKNKNGNLKDTHREETPSNKTPALWKGTIMGVWAVGTLNQLFIRGS